MLSSPALSFTEFHIYFCMQSSAIAAPAKEPSRSRAFKCNASKKKMLRFSFGIRLISICNDPADFHFVSFVWFCASFALYFGSLHSNNYTLWLYFVNNAINCNFENKNKNKIRCNSGDDSDDDGNINKTRKRNGWALCVPLSRSYWNRRDYFVTYFHNDFVAWPRLWGCASASALFTLTSNTPKKIDVTCERRNHFYF